MSTNYFIDTELSDPATQEPVVPEGAEDLLQKDNDGGCCGGACCQG